MTMINQRGSERNAVVGVIPPGNKAAAAYTTGYIPLKNFASLMALINVGTLGAGATVAAKVTVYTDSAGSNALDVPGAAITQLTKAGADDNKLSIMDVDVGRLPHVQQFTHARLTVTVGVAASDVSAVVFGFDTRYGSASLLNLAAVDEIVSV